MREAHTLASRVEDAVRDALDAVDDVIVEVSVASEGPRSRHAWTADRRRVRDRVFGQLVGRPPA